MEFITINIKPECWTVCAFNPSIQAARQVSQGYVVKPCLHNENESHSLGRHLHLELWLVLAWPKSIVFKHISYL